MSKVSHNIKVVTFDKVLLDSPYKKKVHSDQAIRIFIVFRLSERQSILVVQSIDSRTDQCQENNIE